MVVVEGVVPTTTTIYATTNCEKRITFRVINSPKYAKFKMRLFRPGLPYTDKCIVVCIGETGVEHSVDMQTKLHAHCLFFCSKDNTEGSFTSPRIEIDEKSPALTLYFKATVPISCPVIEGRTTCKITIKMEDSNNGLGLSSCNMVFSGLEKDSKPKIQRVKALPTPGILQRTSVIRFRAISTNPEFFWHGYKVPDISVSRNC